MKQQKIVGFVLILVVCLTLANSALAQQRRDPQEYIKTLESERRVTGLQVERVIEALLVKPGMRVCDLGAGSGLFTRPLAQAVGKQGIVYAVDIEDALLAHVAKTAKAAKLTNIKTVLGALDDPKLPEPVDLICIIDTLHHIGNQAPYLKNLKKYLRPNGRIALIDFSRDWPAGHEQMVYQQSDMENWMQAAGFKLVSQHYFLNNNYFVIYQ